MTRSAILTGARTAQKLTEISPSPIFFECHAHAKVVKLLAESVGEIIKRFGVTDALFEMPRTVNPKDFRKFLEEDDKKTYLHICENSEIFPDLIKFSNKNFGTKFDPEDLTRKNISRCIQGLSFDDCVRFISASSHRTKAADSDFAHIIKMVGNGCEDRISIEELAIKTLGIEHCHHVDIVTKDPPNSRPAMAERNLSIADGILRFPSAVGFFGADHYRNEDGTSAVDLIERTYETQHRLAPTALTELKKYPTINPADFVFIHPYSGKPVNETDVQRRTVRPKGAFPIYVFDATDHSIEDFTGHIAEIVKAHREKFSELGGVRDGR